MSGILFFNFASCEPLNTGNTHEIFQTSVFGILWNIMIILSKMLQILTFHNNGT